MVGSPFFKNIVEIIFFLSTRGPTRPAEYFLIALLNNSRNINNVVDLTPMNKDLQFLKNCANEHTWTQVEQCQQTSDLISQRSFGHLWYLLKKGFDTKDGYASWLGQILEGVVAVW